MAFAIVIFRLEAEDKAHIVRVARTVVVDIPIDVDIAEISVAARVRGTQPPIVARPVRDIQLCTYIFDIKLSILVASLSLSFLT